MTRISGEVVGKKILFEKGGLHPVGWWETWWALWGYHGGGGGLLFNVGAKCAGTEESQIQRAIKSGKVPAKSVGVNLGDPDKGPMGGFRIKSNHQSLVPWISGRRREGDHHWGDEKRAARERAKIKGGPYCVVGCWWTSWARMFLRTWAGT